MIAQIKKIYDKVIVGKAIWKLMMVPGILFGKGVVVAAKTTVDKIQAAENRVWKYLLGLGGYTTLESLRGEVGASMMSSRLMETMLSFVIDTLTGEVEDMKTYMLHEIETGKGQWIKMVNQYRNILGITWEEMKEIEKKDLKKRIREYDIKIWREE